MITNNLLTYNNIHEKYFNKSHLKKLSKEYKKIFKEIFNDINNPNKTLNTLNNKFIFNFKLKDLKRFKKFKTIALVGMGGSILGSAAINNFLEKKIKKKIYFFDNIDSKKISNFKKKNINKVLFIVISKSGNTVETLSNLFTLNIIKKNSKNIILISEKKNNLIISLSRRFNLFYIEHKSHVGGRYSVLSEVGVIPAYLMGVNILKLRSNIQIFLKGKDKLFLEDSSLKLASILNSKKINNLIFLNYSRQGNKDSLFFSFFFLLTVFFSFHFNL